MKKKSLYSIITIFSAFLVLVGINHSFPFLRTDLFRSFAKGNCYILSDKDTMYTIGYYGVRKYLVESTVDFNLIAENDQIIKNRITGRGGCISNELLFVTARSFLPGSVKTNSTNGVLYVFKKKDLSVVNALDSDMKLVEVKMHKNSLVVSGLTGFNIYDDSTPSKPVEVFRYRHRNYREYQGFDFIEKDGKVYVVFSLFAEGLEIWDITQPKNASLVSSIPIDEHMEDGNNLPGGQSMDVVVKYPYVYATLGPTSQTYKTSNDRRGILVYNILNLDDIKKSAILIPKTDWYNSLITSGDKQPTSITQFRDSLYVNFGHKGVAVFDITNAAKPIYKGLIDVSGKGALIQPIHASENGMLFTGSYYWSKIYAMDLTKL